MAKTELQFGTDGVRDVAGQGQLHPESVERLGMALGDWLRAQNVENRPVLLGGDTRASRGQITQALDRGLARRKVAVIDLGVLPTAALALLLEEYGASCSAVISASHNPAEDNGIKIFTGRGEKLADADARDIEQRWLELTVPSGSPANSKLEQRSDGGTRYLRTLRALLPGLQLRGMRIALDLAHGAAYQVGVELFRALDAIVSTRADQPNGRNINQDCGAMHPEGLSALVKSTRSDFGLAVDGDADRSIFCDERGRIVDGDGILAAISADLLKQDRLPRRTVVGTLMTNYGLEKLLKARGVALERTPVGDRFVSAKLREGGFGLGGEPSGHLIFGSDLSYVGDGLYTALRVAELMKRTGRPLSDLLSDFEPMPQVLLGVRVSSRPSLEQVSGFREKVADAERTIGGRGRLVIRYSGTEPLVRIMVEGEELSMIQGIANDFAAFFRTRLGSA